MHIYLRLIGRWVIHRAGLILTALVLTALVTSMVLPKDHLAFPLGPGCYYMGADSTSLVQWQHCDEWRKGPVGADAH